MIDPKITPLTRRAYYKKALQLVKAGKLLDLSDRLREETFRGGGFIGSAGSPMNLETEERYLTLGLETDCSCLYYMNWAMNAIP